LRAAPRGRLGVGFCATEAGKPARSFTLDKRLQGLSYNGGFFGDAGIFLCLFEQFVVDRDRGSHRNNSIASNIASFDAHFHAHSRSENRDNFRVVP
jgi:hypothetical protein